MTFHQPLKSSDIAGLGASNHVRFVILGLVHDTGDSQAGPKRFGENRTVCDFLV
jgi:hypothetical protein